MRVSLAYGKNGLECDLPENSVVLEPVYEHGLADEADGILHAIRNPIASQPYVLITGILEEMYELFPILKKRGNQYARTLSGGERQMLAVARSLVSRPKLVMFDEPSLGLAPKLVDDIYEKIRTLKESGLTVLLVEQNTSYALELADRGYVLENGNIVKEGISAVLARDEHIKKHYLGL